MIRKLTVIFLSGLVCLVTVASVLAIEYKEAPMLQVKVAAGELPSVEKRLPKEPIVVEPYKEIGQYGGTWRMALMSNHYIFNSLLNGRMGDREILRYNITGTKLVPNLVDKWIVSQDNKTYTLHWREGLKWSDGQPFTTEDIMFWYEDVILNKELTPTLPGWRRVGDKPTEIEKVDTYTIKIHLSQPNSIYLNVLFGALYPLPKHYLKQFHPKYTPLGKIEKQAKEEGFDYWYQLFSHKASVENPECPVMRIYKLVSASPTRVVAERNPYYWKIDTEGNQLPYIDRIVFNIIASGEVIVMKAISGELDLQIFHLPISSYPILKEGEKKGGYRVLLWPAHTAEGLLLPNHTYTEDPFIRELLRNSTFNKALSLAIDREEVNELIVYGLAVPGQLSPAFGDPLEDEKFTTAYAEYNPDKANKLLDSIGTISKRNKSGFRLRPDGQPLEIKLLITSTWSLHVDMAPLIKKYWEDVGIKVVIDSPSFSLRTERLLANAYQFFMWKVDTPFLFPLYIRVDSPLNPFGYAFGMGPLWSQWEGSGGKKGEKPPKEYFELKSITEKIVSTPNKAEQIALGRKLWQNYVKNLWSFGVLLEPPTLVVKKNCFRNVPDRVLESWTIRGFNTAEVSQFFIKQ